MEKKEEEEEREKKREEGKKLRRRKDWEVVHSHGIALCVTLTLIFPSKLIFSLVK